MSGQDYRHILYYSPSHLEQLFVDRFGEATEISEEKGTQRSRTVSAALNVFLTGKVGSEHQTRKNVIKSVNHSEEYVRTKKIVNELLDDTAIPRMRDLNLNNISSLYRFSCECQLFPEKDGISDTTLVEVVGKEGDFKFRGITSLDNWSSLSDTLFAVRNEIPYPLDEIIQLRDINDQVIRDEIDYQVLDQADCDVNFIFICQSSRKEVQKWWNRRDLLNEYYEKIDPE